MPRGQPDYGPFAVTETIAGLSDMGELAVRLGSVVTFDRRGDVVWYDDFQGGLGQWFVWGSGDDYEAYITAKYSLKGSFSCKLITGASDSRYVYINHEQGGLVHSKIGVEASFTLTDDIDNVHIGFWYYDGTTFYDSAIIYNPITSELLYQPPVGVDIPFATGVELETTVYTFHTLKYVIDLPNKTYNRVLLNNLSYDLSAIPIRAIAFPAHMYYAMQIRTTAIADENITTYAGHAIVTQNEP